jgi:hypothetical protein
VTWVYKTLPNAWVSQKTPNVLKLSCGENHTHQSVCPQNLCSTGHQRTLTWHVAHLILCLVRSWRTQNSVLQLFNELSIEHPWEYRDFQKLVWRVCDYNVGDRFHRRLQIGRLCREAVSTISRENALASIPLIYCVYTETHNCIFAHNLGSFFTIKLSSSAGLTIYKCHVVLELPWYLMHLSQPYTELQQDLSGK